MNLAISEAAKRPRSTVRTATTARRETRQGCPSQSGLERDAETRRGWRRQASYRHEADTRPRSRGSRPSWQQASQRSPHEVSKGATQSRATSDQRNQERGEGHPVEPRRLPQAPCHPPSRLQPPDPLRIRYTFPCEESRASHKQSSSRHQPQALATNERADTEKKGEQLAVFLGYPHVRRTTRFCARSLAGSLSRTLTSRPAAGIGPGPRQEARMLPPRTIAQPNPRQTRVKEGPGTIRRPRVLRSRPSRPELSEWEMDGAGGPTSQPGPTSARTPAARRRRGHPVGFPRRAGPGRREARRRAPACPCRRPSRQPAAWQTPGASR